MAHSPVSGHQQTILAQLLQKFMKQVCQLNICHLFTHLQNLVHKFLHSNLTPSRSDTESDIMHAVDTLITPGSSTATPEDVQVTPAQGGEKEWRHPADMDGWVKVRDQELCRSWTVQLPPQDNLVKKTQHLPLLADQPPEPQTYKEHPLGRPF